MSVLAHLLACLFGTGSWISINGLWVELPLRCPWRLVPALLPLCLHPDGKYRSRFCQSDASIPSRCPQQNSHHIRNHRSRHCSFLLRFFWKKTVVVASAPHSVARHPKFLPLCCWLHVLCYLSTLHDAPETPLLVHLLRWRGCEWSPPCSSSTGPRCWGGKLCQQHPVFEPDSNCFQWFCEL